MKNVFTDSLGKFTYTSQLIIDNIIPIFKNVVKFQETSL